MKNEKCKMQMEKCKFPFPRVQSFSSDTYTVTDTLLKQEGQVPMPSRPAG